MTKENLKIKYFHFAWLWKMNQKVELCCRLNENCQVDSTWSCENFTQSCEMLQEDVNCYCCIFLFHIIMRNCLSSCEMTILLLNSRFLDEEASGRPLRWCQVSTWPWPINRNLIFSWKSFLDISNCIIF